MYLLRSSKCFLVEHLTPGVLPAYYAYPGVHPVVVQDGKAVHIEPSKSGQFVVPLENIPDSEKERLCWEVLLETARTLPSFPLHAVRKTMALRDLDFAGFVRRDGFVLAVASLEFVGLYVIVGNRCGITCFNPNGVFLIDPVPTDDEILVARVLES